MADATQNVTIIGNVLTAEGLIPADQLAGLAEEDRAAVLAGGLTWARRNIQPPTLHYIASGHRLFVRIQSFLSSVSIRVSGFLQRIDGHIDEINSVISGDPTVAALEQMIELQEGYLLALSVVSLTEGTGVGNTFCTVAVARGSLNELIAPRLLIARYLPCDQFVGWPGHSLQNSLEGPGSFHVESFTPFSSGDPILIVVPAGQRWQIVGGFGTYTTSSSPGNRSLLVWLEAKGVAIFRAVSPSAVPASTTVNITLTAGANPFDPTTTEQVFALPGLTELPPGGRIIVSVDGVFSTDTFGTFRLLVKRWLEE